MGNRVSNLSVWGGLIRFRRPQRAIGAALYRIRRVVGRAEIRSPDGAQRNPETPGSALA
jgi:hypothetical protein